MSRKNITLNANERSDAQFLTSLAAALSNYDFSGKNFRKFGSRIYSLMIDNYQIQVAQTGTHYYPTRFHKLIGDAKYAFEPGKYERYEVYVYENRYPMHRLDSDDLLLGTPIDTWLWRSNSNTLFMNATMATDRCVYRTTCFDGRPQDMFIKQNAHLFEPARQLYSVFHNNESKLSIDKISDKTEYKIRPLLDKYEMEVHRANLLNRIKDEIFHRKK